MPQPSKIALVPERGDGLRRLLSDRPKRMKIRAFDDLFAEFPELVRFAPELVFVDRDAPSAEDAGALRALLASIPDVRVVLVGSAARELELADLAERLGARVLLRPFDRRAVAAVMAVAGTPEQPDPDVFLDLARGISDEINNPLLFASGHLQLLETMLDPERDADALDQLRAAQRGLARIDATMERIRTLGRARALPEPAARVPLGRLVREALAELPEPARAALHLRDDAQPDESVVRGDERLLGTALRAFVAIGVELAALAAHAALVVAPLERSLRVRLEFRELAIGDWRLPRTFEPYHLNRVLRGTPHGLALFLVQTVVHAHGGQATARRRADGELVLDLLVPRAPAER